MHVPIDLESRFNGRVGIDLITPKELSIGIEFNKTFDHNYDINHFGLRLNTPF